MPTHLAKLSKDSTCSCTYFFGLWIIGIGGLMGFFLYHLQYTMFCSRSPYLSERRTSLINDDSNPTDPLCSHQTQNNIHYWTRILVLYSMSIPILALYVWHRSVRFWHFALVFCMLAYVLYYTSFVLYFETFVYDAFFTSLITFMAFSGVHGLVPDDCDDPLRALCEDMVRPLMLDEFFPNGNSMSARFYRWMKKIKVQSGIEEEKLFITFVFGIIANGFLAIAWLTRN